MQDFVLNLTWVSTAICVVAFSIMLVMFCGGGLMYVILRGYYFLKVQQEHMEQKAEQAIFHLRVQKEDELDPERAWRKK